MLRWPANVMFAQGQHQILSCCQAQGQRLKGCQRNVTVILQNSVKAPLKVPFGESFAYIQQTSKFQEARGKRQCFNACTLQSRLAQTDKNCVSNKHLLSSYTAVVTSLLS